MYVVQRNALLVGDLNKLDVSVVAHDSADRPRRPRSDGIAEGHYVVFDKFVLHVLIVDGRYWSGLYPSPVCPDPF